MAKGRNRQRQRLLTKAVSPNIAAMAAQAQNLGTQAQTRPFGLMEAINMATGQGGFDALYRNPVLDSMPFGPMNPLVPEPIDPLNSQQRTDPRTWEYAVGWNLPGSGQREVPWQVLTEASMGVGIIRRCIEVRKKHARNLRWTFGPTQEAIQELYEKDPGKGKLEAERQLREQLAPEIRRLKEYWRKPWASNDLSFGQWMSSFIEMYLVYDAFVVYPQTSYAGEVINLRIIDPTTIKPLVDEYGDRPAPPSPAFQQVLYGFPRGEFLASVVRDPETGAEVIENAFAQSELFYYRENYRPRSPYGLSATEQALYDSRLWLQRQQWMLAEYDDGSTPLTWLETPLPTPGVPGLTLAQAREWIALYNQKNAGQTKERVRAKVLPNGWKAAQPAGIDERYRPEYDLYLIKLLCSYFGVPASELGFSESSGLGGKGFSEGQADVSGRVGQRPDVAVATDVVNAISTQFLRMPKEIEFSFTDPVGQNDAESATITKERITTAQLTINEARVADGNSRLPFAEADMPFLLGGPQGIIFLDGAKAAIDAAVEQTKVQAESLALGTAGKLEMDKAKLDDGKEARREQQEFAREERDAGQEFAREEREASTNKAAEIEAFRNFARKRALSGKPVTRPFVFKHVTPEDLPELWHCPPELADFSGVQEGSPWVWQEDDLEKAARIKSGLSWLDWNARHPNKQRDARGRWVKGGGPNMSAQPRAFEWKPSEESRTVGSMDVDTEIAELEKEIADLQGDFGPAAAGLRRELKSDLDALKIKRAKERGKVTKAAEPDGQAGGADPKAQEPATEPVPPVVPPDMRWPGWLVDLAIAGVVSADLLAGMRLVTTGATISAVIDALYQWAKPGRAQRSPEGVAEWLKQETELRFLIEAAIRKPVQAAHIEGGLVGQRSARAVLDAVQGGWDPWDTTGPAVEFGIDWGGWKPGHPEAARLLLDPGGLERLLAQSNATIRGITSNRLDDLGKLIARGLVDGKGPDEIARRIEEWGANPAKARQIAVTETSRAMSAATEAEYIEGGVEEKGWLTALDQRVCRICDNNAFELDRTPRLIPVFARFPSGDRHPPAHPECRCALVPGMPKALRSGPAGAHRGMR